jgi:hypothetical protein
MFKDQARSQRLSLASEGGLSVIGRARHYCTGRAEWKSLGACRVKRCKMCASRVSRVGVSGVTVIPHNEPVSGLSLWRAVHIPVYVSTALSRWRTREPCIRCVHPKPRGKYRGPPEEVEFEGKRARQKISRDLRIRRARDPIAFSCSKTSTYSRKKRHIP